MRLKSGPFVIAAGLGAALQFAVTLVSTLATYFSMAPVFNSAGTGDFDQTPLVLASALSGLVCLCAVVLDIATGAGYSLLARRSGEVDIGDGAIGGLLSATVARLVSGLFGAVVSVAVTALVFNQAGVDTSADGPSLIFVSLASGAIGGLISICIGAVVGAVLGAMGGGVAAAIVSRGSA